MRKICYMLVLLPLAVFAGFLVNTFIRSLNVEPLPAVEGPNYTDYIIDPGLFPQGGEVTVTELPYNAGDHWSIHTIMNETEFQQYISIMFINGTSITYDEYHYNVNWGLYQIYLPYDFIIENYGTTTWALTVVDVNGNEKDVSHTT